jgi:hypothetical protein
LDASLGDSPTPNIFFMFGLLSAGIKKPPTETGTFFSVLRVEHNCGIVEP